MWVEIGALPQQAVGALIRAALPWAVRIAEVVWQIGGDGQLSMTSHLGPLIPEQGPEDAGAAERCCERWRPVRPRHRDM